MSFTNQVLKVKVPNLILNVDTNNAYFSFVISLDLNCWSLLFRNGSFIELYLSSPKKETKNKKNTLSGSLRLFQFKWVVLISIPIIGHLFVVQNLMIIVIIMCYLWYITFCHSRVDMQYSLFDFIRGGLLIQPIVAIDFTVISNWLFFLVFVNELYIVFEYDGV